MVCILKAYLFGLQEALSSLDANFWKEAINDEMDSLESNETCLQSFGVVHTNYLTLCLKASKQWTNTTQSTFLNMHQSDTRKAHKSKTQNPRWSILQNDVLNNKLGLAALSKYWSNTNQIIFCGLQVKPWSITQSIGLDKETPKK